MELPKQRDIIFQNLTKAYVEGIYNDSPLNRKLGRVGMSYKEYHNMVSEKEEKGGGNKEEKTKNEIPLNIGDLKFDKEGRAHYEVDGKKIDIELISHIKHGEKNFSLTIDGKKYENLNTTQLSRRLKAIAGGKYDFTDSGKKMSDTIPLSAEEFDDLYGDIGFNYTYYKDNLDIRVWIREDSDKKDPRFNIYVIDSETKKKKSYTKLSLLEAHNKLLEFDLNPDIEKPLSKEQLKEIERIKKEKGIIKKNPNTIEPSKDIGIEFDSTGSAKFKIDGGYCEVQVLKENPSILDIWILDEEGKVQGVDYTDVDNFKDFISNYDIELNDENQVKYIHNSAGVNVIMSLADKPLKEIVENYFDKITLLKLNSIGSTYRHYYPNGEDEEKLKGKILGKKLAFLPGQKRDWNRELRQAYTFINSKHFVDWLNDMPNSKKEGVTKKQIYNDIKDLSERFSPGGSIKGIYNIHSLQNYIIDTYY